MQAQLTELKARLLMASDLNMAAALLNWDQSTYMPPGGATARGRQQALLAQLAQEKGTDPAIGKLLDELRPYEEGLPYDSDDASLIRVARREYERNTRVPPAFVAEMFGHFSASMEVWSKARPANDFAAVRPYLEKTVDLSRRLAEFFPGYEHIADPLIDFSDYGMKVSTLRPLFADLRNLLVPLVEAIARQPQINDTVLRRHYPEQAQWNFGLDVIRRFGYDFQRGRQDKSPHPFTTKFSLGDVRITTRVNENDLGEALFSTMHEAGHAMYEQGIRQEFEGTPLGGGTSAGVHESQSRLWENLVGRSLPFWTYFYPRLQAAFPGALDAVSLDEFYRAINKAQPSLIRTSADEVTYNLHIIIRFELELELLEGRLGVKDLPDVWHERYREYLGVSAPDDRHGVMQDIHWFFGPVGGSFQGYTLGNVMSAIFFDAATRAHPDISDQMAQEGRFDTLRAWLTENIYQHGSKFTAAELVQRVAGGPLSIEPYARYLRTKYGEIYQ